MKSNAAYKTLAKLLACFCFFAVAGSVFGETRSATTGVAVRVERHTGVVIAPAPTSSSAQAISGVEESRVSSSGNGTALVMRSVDPARAGAQARTAVTIFEP